MRRRPFAVLGIVVLTLVGLGAAPQAVPDAAGVRAAEDGWSKAFVSGDAAFLEGLLDPAYVSVGSRGNARSKAEIIALAKRYAAEHPGAAATATPLPPTSTIDVKGTAAVVTHHNTGETSVDVFYFADGRWRAWYSQHTAIAPTK